MITLTITTLISAIPALLPISKVVKKQELNIWDLIILFSTLNFSMLPMLNGGSFRYTSEGILNVFYCYIPYILLLLLIDKKASIPNKKINLYNTTAFLNSIDGICFSTIGKIIIAIVLVFIAVVYIPLVSVIVIKEEAGLVNDLDYTVSSGLMIATSLIYFIGVLLSYSILSHRRGKYDRLMVLLFSVYMLEALFLPRRDFIYIIIVVAIIFYSINRRYINRKFYTIMGVTFLFLYLVYFPFYNVFRHNDISFDSSKPVTSFINIIEYGAKNFNKEKGDAASSTDERSVNLYDAVYKMINYSDNYKYGELTLLAIDHASPRVLNPNKGEGTEKVMEAMTKQGTDQADSLLLLGVGEFGFLGGLYGAFLFYVLFAICNVLSRIIRKYTRCTIVPIYFLFNMVSISWNIETGFDAELAKFVTAIITVLIFVILEKTGTIKFINIQKQII